MPRSRSFLVLLIPLLLLSAARLASSQVVPALVASLEQRTERDLLGNILPFWMEKAVDHERGGFVAEISERGVVNNDRPRGPLLSARILWTYSAAFRQYKDPRYLAMARRAHEHLQSSYWDLKYGGYVWAIDPAGRVIDDRKQIYGQSFAIYGLAEYYRASGDKTALERAIELYRLVQAHSRDRVNGGYLEAFTRDWRRPEGMQLSGIGPEEPKSQNTHLHLMEAFTTLYRAWPDEGLRGELRELVLVMLDKIRLKDGRHLGMYFSEQWTLRSNRVSYGHEIEASWLLTEAGEVLGETPLLARIHQAALILADSTLAEGVDADGALYNEGTPMGADDLVKEWWPQAEALVGFINAYQISGDAKYLSAAEKTWSFVETHLIDPVYGDWIRSLTREGKPRPGLYKAGYWKCPYHNGRAGLEAVRRLSSLRAAVSAGAAP